VDRLRHGPRRQRRDLRDRGTGGLASRVRPVLVPSGHSAARRLQAHFELETLSRAIYQGHITR
jgi:hypothetical protein